MTNTLILRSNEITKFRWCGNFLLLQTLDLSCNNLTNISILAYSNLTLGFLNLSHNKIEFLEKGYFKNMTFLLHLDLSHNRIMQFYPVSSQEIVFDPWGTGYFQYYLNTLNLSNNRLTYVPTSFFAQFKRLSILKLSSNRITYVKEMSFRNLTELVTLDLSCNRLKHLSIGENALDNGLGKHQGEINCSLTIFLGLIHLRTLNVSRNKVTYLSQTAFCELTRLEMLDLTWNYLQFLSRNVFEGLNDLTDLLLRGNHIWMIDSSAFLPLRQVNTINLEDNYLSDLSDNLFDGNSNLTELQLRNNNLITVPWVVSKWNQSLSLYSHCILSTDGSWF